MNMDLLVRSLEKNGYTVSCFETAEEAACSMAERIRGVTVGFGDSATLAAMELASRLAGHNTVIDPSGCSGAEFLEVSRRALTTDVFVTSVNGVAETGELVNIDGTGNRVAGSLFGHKQVFFVFGINKVEPTLERAIWRARNIAAPQNAKRFGYKTPCAVKGDRCYDCQSPQRICNTMNIHLKKLKNVEAEAVIIRQSLGM